MSEEGGAFLQPGSPLIAERIGLPPGPGERALVEQARALAEGPLAAYAARYDREAAFPWESYRHLREAGFLALCVPARYGGLGADYRTYALAAAELARGCPATALTFNMHTCTMLWTGPLADDLEMTGEQRRRHERNRRRFYEEVVEEGALFAQPFSEGGVVDAGPAPFGTEAVAEDGGWRIRGRKVFASLAGAADYYGVLCTEQGGGIRETLYLAVPAGAPGVAVTGEWDPVGMRGTVSRVLELEGVRVEETHELMPRGLYHRATLEWPHMFFTLAPTYLGIAEAAFEFTVRYLRGEIPGAGGRPRRESPTRQLGVAELRLLLEQARALFAQVLREAAPRPSRGARLRALAAQYTVMEHANELCRRAIRVCGGHTVMRRFPLERLYRDSRCGSLMLPWTADICMERLGRESLWEPGEHS